MQIDIVDEKFLDVSKKSLLKYFELQKIQF
jgi:hypothetical protein